jgi:hypothetical protein
MWDKGKGKFMKYLANLQVGVEELKDADPRHLRIGIPCSYSKSRL